MFLRHSSCPKCGSKDNLGVYDDHAYCYTPNCGYWSGNKASINFDVGNIVQVELTGVIDAIQDRRISKATCERFNVHVEYDSSGNISKHHYPYYRANTSDVAFVKTRIVQK